MAETSTKKLTETYTKKLTEAEYLGIFNLGAFFDGSEQARFAASKISEKIADAVRAGTREVVVLDEKNNPKLLADGSPETAQKAPESIEITLTRKELDGYYIGVKESLKKGTVKTSEIAQIKLICGSLGMSGRFAKYADEVVASIEVSKDGLDEETVEEPLD